MREILHTVTIISNIRMEDWDKIQPMMIELYLLRVASYIALWFKIGRHQN